MITSKSMTSGVLGGFSLLRDSASRSGDHMGSSWRGVRFPLGEGDRLLDQDRKGLPRAFVSSFLTLFLASPSSLTFLSFFFLPSLFSFPGALAKLTLTMILPPAWYTSLLCKGDFSFFFFFFSLSSLVSSRLSTSLSFFFSSFFLSFFFSTTGLTFLGFSFTGFSLGGLAGGAAFFFSGFFFRGVRDLLRDLLLRLSRLLPRDLELEDELEEELELEEVYEDEDEDE